MIAIGSITSANATMALTFAGLFSQPQSIQQFDVDDSFDTDDIENSEIVKGVDGIMTFGWLPTMVHLTISLMANSPSNQVFDQVFMTEQQQRTKIVAAGSIVAPDLFTQWTIQNGLLFRYKPTPAGKKRFQGRKFVMVLDQLLPSPYVGAG